MIINIVFEMADFKIRKALRILLLTNGTVLFSGAMFGPVYAIFVEKVGGDILDAGIGATVYALVAAIAVLIFGKYSDRIKQNELLVAAGYVLIAIGYFLYLSVDTVAMMLVCQCIIGLGEAVYSPSFDAIYSKHLKQENAGTSWAMWEAMNYFTWAGGAFVGGVVASYFGFKSVFVMMAVLALWSAWYIYRLPRQVL